MPGTSCENCVFSVRDKQTQVGCSLNRLEKYTNVVDVLDDDLTGTYKVLTDNICTAKRSSQWLNKHAQGEAAVRKELYPKVQLFVLIDEFDYEWVGFFEANDFSKFSAVDVLVFQPERDFVKYLGHLLHRKNFFLHACYSPPREQINHLVRSDCQFYITSDDANDDEIDEWPQRVDYYINDLVKPLFLIRDNTWSEEPYRNGMLVYTPLHFMLGGFGSQSIDEKIEIHSKNHDMSSAVITPWDFWSATEGVYNKETHSGTDTTP